VSVNREKKEQMVKELSEQFAAFDSYYLLDFMNMPVSLTTQFRRQLRENSYSLRVVKNRLALRALKEETPEDLKISFQGPTALAFAEKDPVGLARLIKQFSTENKVLSVKAGMIEGQFLEKDMFEGIAKLSSKEDLIAKLGYLMAYPLIKLLRTWQAPLTSLGSVLGQLKSNK
jgi:large subunit ribosomal protein L10